MKPKLAVGRSEPKRRDGTLPTELRELEKLIQSFADEFSFARAEVQQLKKKTAGAIAAWQMAEARHRQEHHQTRARLNTLFNGRIERWIYASDDEEMKTFFRRVWRDAPNQPKNQADKEPPNLGGLSAAEEKASAQPTIPADSQPSSTPTSPKRG